MKRTQIRLDDQIYRKLRDEAHAKHTSIAALVREAVKKYLSLHRKRHCVLDFTFIGSGRSDQGKLEPVSERHDEALKEALS